ncbi:MAG: T9SS type A sorting domain-containing protein [Bacteroidetes bacterium]|nr:T9SS type A sorting domain-containing protein [Bacteroidota bacterium]
MRHEHFKFSVLIFLGVGLSTLQAQKSVPASGGDASGSEGTVSYTVGQVIYTTYTGTNGSMAQGVQQPYEISVVAGIADENGINLTLLAYPNPATEYIKLKADKTENLTYQLYDISGKLLDNKKIEDSETNIAMSNFVNATYFLKISNNNKEVKTFKIIKN